MYRYATTPEKAENATGTARDTAEDGTTAGSRYSKREIQRRAGTARNRHVNKQTRETDTARNRHEKQTRQETATASDRYSGRKRIQQETDTADDNVQVQSQPNRRMRDE